MSTSIIADDILGPNPEAWFIYMWLRTKFTRNPFTQNQPWTPNFENGEVLKEFSYLEQFTFIPITTMLVKQHKTPKYAKDAVMEVRETNDIFRLHLECLTQITRVVVSRANQLYPKEVKTWYDLIKATTVSDLFLQAPACSKRSLENQRDQLLQSVAKMNTEEESASEDEHAAVAYPFFFARSIFVYVSCMVCMHSKTPENENEIVNRFPCVEARNPIVEVSRQSMMSWELLSGNLIQACLGDNNPGEFVLPLERSVYRTQSIFQTSRDAMAGMMMELHRLSRSHSKTLGGQVLGQLEEFQDLCQNIHARTLKHRPKYLERKKQRKFSYKHHPNPTEYRPRLPKTFQRDMFLSGKNRSMYWRTRNNNDLSFKEIQVF